MSEPNQEPTMEEILASIRRIISEDDTPADAAQPEAHAASEPEPEPEPEPAARAPDSEPEPAPEPAATAKEEEVLELTDRVAAPDVLELTDRVRPEESHGDIDVYAREESKPVSGPEFGKRPRAVDEEPLVAPQAEDVAASAFGRLAQTLAMPAEGRTLEDVVKELLRPMLKAWLDDHLPAIVQARVEAEVDRIARIRGR